MVRVVAVDAEAVLLAPVPVAGAPTVHAGGQCHGTIFRDWREGIHGRREGYWNGAKSYLLCAHCHNPHAPRFQAIEPLPPPVRPQFLRAAAEEGHNE